MVDPISNTASPRELGSSPNRPQYGVPGAPGAETKLPPDHRIEALQAAVEKLIKKNLPSNSKLQIEQDKNTGTFIYRSINPDTGEVIRQWPPEKLLELRDYLKELAGVLVNRQV
jgi:uncharacterized FlaG/YvyC family protein